MIAAVYKKLYFRDLMAMCVCDLQSKYCMLHHCDQRPNILAQNVENQIFHLLHF